ncbi:MAG TPA: MOSC domain-containing protein [Chthonomonadaceae bacterium]|nr:MOSC domain-containing protein [Chthonomonadaceae bacterium]
MGELVSIVYKPQDAAPSVENYTRVPRQQALLVAGYGIENDTKGGHSDRHLNIMAAHALEALAEEGFRTAPGQLGEQLILADVEIDSLPPGTRLQIGDAACVELTEPRTGCGKFERHQGKLRQEAAGRLGMMARVVIGGEVAVGDPVTVVAEVAALK